MVKQVTIGYCCQWLLCILGWLLQATRGNHVCLQQVCGQKPKSQIDSTYKVKNLHIHGEEKLGYYLTDYHQKEFTSQNLVTIFGSSCLQCNKGKSVHVYLQSCSCGLVNYIIQICHKIHQICCHLLVYLSLLSFIVVITFL